MAKYRKKPVVIDAYQLQPDDGQTRRLPPPWFIGGIVTGKLVPTANDGLLIGTLEGSMQANVGDWVIQGIAGELYPCKPEIFEQTYELVE